MRGVTPYEVFDTLEAGISIHTPHAGSDPRPSALFVYYVQFQSTLPMRGVTTGFKKDPAEYEDFNPHSPCGE